MTWFPAFAELMRDPQVAERPAVQRVYVHLTEDPRILYEPRDVKAWLVAQQLGMSRDTVNDALDCLIKMGYLLDHGRGQNNVRRVSIIGKRPEQEAG